VTSAKPKGEQKKVWTPDKGNIRLKSDIDQTKLRKREHGPARRKGPGSEVVLRGRVRTEDRQDIKEG